MSSQATLLFRFKVMVGIIVTMLFLLGCVLVAQGLINTPYYRAQIEQRVKEKTGHDLKIRGEVSISLLPVPTLYLPGVELRDNGSEPPTPALTAEMVQVIASPTAFFSGQPQVTRIIFQRPTLEITRAENNRIAWDWLDERLLHAAAGAADAVTIVISDGSILYSNRRAERDIVIENIQAKGSVGAQPDMSGSFTLYGHELAFNARTAAAPGGGALPVSIGLSSGDGNRLTLEGSVDLASEMPGIQGKFGLELNNILEWTKPKVEEKRRLIDQITNVSSEPEQQQAPLPIMFSGEWDQAGASLRLANVHFKGLDSEGTGTLDILWEEIPRVTTALDFSVFDYDQWRRLANQWLKDNENALASRRDVNGLGQPGNPLPEDITVTLKATAAQVNTGGQQWKSAKLSADLEHAAVTINQFGVLLPGDAALSLFGIISQGSTGGMRFEGNMEAQGKSLRHVLTIFDNSAMALPELGSGAFAVRSNVYVAADQLRLSEADVQISDLHLNGGLVAYYDAAPRLEAEVKLKNINFDYFRDTWREKNNTGRPEQFFLRYDKNLSFDWLKKLRTSIDLRIAVDQFHFLDRDGKSASFRLFAKQGEFGIYNVRLFYPENALEGNFSLNVTGEQPLVNLLLNTNTLDTGYFFAPAQEAEAAAETPAKKSRWPETLIDMSWMEGFDGVFDISLGRLVHLGKALDNFKLQAKLENNVLNAQALSFACWQGRCSAKGSLYGGKVPGISVGFTLYGADLQELLQSFAERDNISGKISVSGTWVTSGVNILSWVSQSDAELVFTGRGVNVDRFNLQGVADAVAVSRTAADVVGNVNLALLNGSTDMAIDGNINVKSGVMRTPGITLRAPAATGNLIGELRLLPWTMQLSSLYQFPVAASETVPTMTLQFTGPVNAPQMQLDTSSLEAYVAKRLIGGSMGK